MTVIIVKKTNKKKPSALPKDKSEDMMGRAFCNECGAKNPLNLKFCSKCGGKLR